jgi:hypothetical protein
MYFDGAVVDFTVDPGPETSSDFDCMGRHGEQRQAGSFGSELTVGDGDEVVG